MPIVIIQLIKSLHVLTAAGLIGALIFCLASGAEIKENNHPSYINVRIRLVGTTLLAAVTGVLLVYPRHFTFHTPWIQAAILGTTTVFMLLIIFFPRNALEKPNKKRFLCIVLIPLLMIIVHDAVTKHTFLIKDIQSPQQSLHI